MKHGILTLVDALFQEAYICASVGSINSRLQFKATGPNFHAELIPVHSPLLRESYLVSYPPLTYMLKFSGFALPNFMSAWEEVTELTMVGALQNNKERSNKRIRKLDKLSSETCSSHSQVTPCMYSYASVRSNVQDLQPVTHKGRNKQPKRGTR